MHCSRNRFLFEIQADWPILIENDWDWLVHCCSYSSKLSTNHVGELHSMHTSSKLDPKRHALLWVWIHNISHEQLYEEAPTILLRELNPILYENCQSSFHWEKGVEIWGWLALLLASFSWLPSKKISWPIEFSCNQLAFISIAFNYIAIEEVRI